MHEWALAEDDDVDDLRLVKRVNPASWQTLELLRERHDSPSMLPWQWKRFACGIWTNAADWWVSAEDWQQAGCTETLEPGDRVTIGFDGSRSSDATALIACRLEDGLLQPLGVWMPDERDGIVPAGEVVATLAEAMETYRVMRGYFDPPQWQTDIDGWAAEYGDTAVMRYETNRTRMKHAVERFRTDLVAGRLRHTGDETLMRHVLNVQMQERRGGYVLSKSRPGSPDKIDAAVAAVLAYEARADAIAAGALEPPRRGQLISF